MKFQGGVYGIPETQEFLMLFYRKDILGQLGLAVPETWEDVEDIELIEPTPQRGDKNELVD